MRRFILAVALIAACFGAMSATAGTASAASCSASTSNIYWDGLLEFNAHLWGCTWDVDKINFKHLSPPGYNGIWDANYAWFHSATQCWGCGADIPIRAAPYNTAAAVYGTPSWCGGAVRTVTSYFGYRIHNSQQGTWGPWHTYGGNWYENINC